MPALSRVPSLARAPSPTLAGLGFDILNQFEPTSHEALVRESSLGRRRALSSLIIHRRVHTTSTATAIVYSSASISSNGEERERSPTISPFLFRRARRAFPFPEDEDSSSSSGDEQKLSPGPSGESVSPLETVTYRTGLIAQTRTRESCQDQAARTEAFHECFCHIGALRTDVRARV